jgi:hypothetical protein
VPPHRECWPSQASNCTTLGSGCLSSESSSLTLASLQWEVGTVAQVTLRRRLVSCSLPLSYFPDSWICKVDLSRLLLFVSGPRRAKLHIVQASLFSSKQRSAIPTISSPQNPELLWASVNVRKESFFFFFFFFWDLSMSLWSSLRSLPGIGDFGTNIIPHNCVTN